MPPDFATVATLNPDGTSEEALLEWWPEGSECKVRIRCAKRETVASAADYFEAFGEARLPFEREGKRFTCYGASLNVRPSGMGRDMGLGLRAYQLELGVRGGKLKFIFDSGPDVQPATVPEQEAYFTSWAASIQ